jgi:SCY1-like protein 1
MPQDDKEKLVVPVIIKLFSSPDRGIRRCLLENIQSFGPELSNQLVEDQIYPKIQPGFTDANPYIRELTLKSMVILGPKLNSRTLNQTLLKFLAKLQVDEEPGIRANTTILLGTLATHFSESTRKKVLLNAMSRALKDPFPPAKMAALKSLQSTSTLHTTEDVATKVIPMVSPLCVDSVQDVRILATTCLEEFFNVIKGNGPCNKERLAARQAAYNNGAWVREAATAYAKKKAERKDKEAA